MIWNMVNLPERKGERGEDGSVWDTGEGGLAFFFVVLPKARKSKDRLECSITKPSWFPQDVVLSPRLFQRINDELWDKWDENKKDGRGTWIPSQPLDLCMLIGSTKQSIWVEEKGHYFKPTYEDLNEKGKQMFNLIRDIYFEEPLIVTLLDT